MGVLGFVWVCMFSKKARLICAQQIAEYYLLIKLSVVDAVFVAGLSGSVWMSSACLMIPLVCRRKSHRHVQVNLRTTALHAAVWFGLKFDPSLSLTSSAQLVKCKVMYMAEVTGTLVTLTPGTCCASCLLLFFGEVSVFFSLKGWTPEQPQLIRTSLTVFCFVVAVVVFSNTLQNNIQWEMPEEKSVHVDP